MNKFSKIVLSSLAAFAPFLLAGSASAVDLDVSATVVESCAISTTPVAFGNYDPTGANAASPLDAAGSVTVSCTTGSVATILLGQGLNHTSGSDAVPARKMVDGATNTLNYNLYTDTNHSDLWGNTKATGSADQTGTGTAGTPVVVYGRVTAGQNVPAGSYTDTVDATVTF